MVLGLVEEVSVLELEVSRSVKIMYRGTQLLSKICYLQCFPNPCI